MGERILSFHFFHIFFFPSDTPSLGCHQRVCGVCECTPSKWCWRSSQRCKECERVWNASHRRRDVWRFVWFTDGCLFGCGCVATYEEMGKIYFSFSFHFLSLSLFLSLFIHISFFSERGTLHFTSVFGRTVMTWQHSSLPLLSLTVFLNPSLFFNSHTHSHALSPSLSLSLSFLVPLSLFSLFSLFSFSPSLSPSLSSPPSHRYTHVHNRSHAYSRSLKSKYTYAHPHTFSFLSLYFTLSPFHLCVFSIFCVSHHEYMWCLTYFFSG